MFLSVNELIGLPGMPGTAPGVRAALNKRAGTSSDMKQKRAGTKAFEYHIDCLPAETQEAVREKHFHSILKADEQPVKVARQPSISANDQLQILRSCPAILQKKTAELTAEQRAAPPCQDSCRLELKNFRGPETTKMNTYSPERKAALIARM
ncbi:DNA-binding protein, partial [Serratia ficaria]|uniref:DNA-binding protein n=1 Tax=Serratia ficaria TaxID=61651 RepID=UPI002915EFBA